MNQSLFARVLVAFCAIGLGVTACGDKDDAAPAGLAAFDQADDVLAFVPADSPYVFASLAALPDDVLDKLEANSDSMFSAYQLVIEETMKSMAEAGELSDDDDAKTLEFLSRLVGMMRSDNLRAAGIPRSPRVAFYGMGLLPVARFSLSDNDAFEAKITELAGEIDADLEDGEVDGQPYRYVGDDDGRLVIAVIGSQAVVAVVPTSLSEPLLKTVLGLTRPDASMADSGKLADLAKQYDLAAYALGFFDVERVVATFLDASTGVDAALLELMDYDPSDISDVCRDEIREVSRIAPRLVAGYNSVSSRSISSNTIFEMRSDLATGLKALASPVPGMGMDHGGFASFGMSLDLMAAREFYEARLDALEADPFRCEYFAEMQAGVAQGRQSLNAPIPPVFYGFKGFLAVIDDIGDIDFASQQPPTDIDARFLVANDNVQGLLAMGSMFSPELAALNIEPNGEPVALNLPPFTSQVDAAFVAMTDNTLGIGIGEGSEGSLATLVDSPVANPPPFMSVSLDGERYYDFMSDVIRAGAANDDQDVSPEAQRAMSTVMTGVGDLIERITVNIMFTDNGIEMPSEVTLAD